MKIVIFDTETSGLDENENAILQLSWQVIDPDENTVIKTRNAYFDYPEDKNAVVEQAIAVNGLTKERLAELGTCDKCGVLKEFLADLNASAYAVGHNVKFDWKFVNAEAAKCGISDFNFPFDKCVDTMSTTIDLCMLPGKKKYKWPKLSELANVLHIEMSDITLHDSRYDVELTKRCFEKLYKNGFYDLSVKDSCDFVVFGF